MKTISTCNTFTTSRIIVGMSTKTQPKKKYPHPFNIRVDDLFLTAVKELRRMDDEFPSQSDVVRQAVLEKLARATDKKAKRV